MLLRAQSARRQMRLAQALSPRANDEGSGRFSLDGRAIVSKVRETCEHLATLRQGDELATVNGATVPSPLRNSDFDSLLKIIKAAARPLHLSFARRPPRATPPPPRPAPPRPRAATAAAPAAPAAPAKRADEDAERSWEDFIKQQRLEHVG